MKSRTVFPLFAVTALVAAALPRDEIKLVAREGIALTRTFAMLAANESETTSDDMSYTVSGDWELLLVVTDAVQEVDDGRVTKLQRTYDEFTGEGENDMESDDGSFGGSDSSTYTVASEVEGSTVIFEWDEEDEEYVASSEDLDDDILDELPYDYDFAAFLPGEDVAEGDEWEIDLEEFKRMTSPWEGLPIEWESGDEDEAMIEDDAEEPEIDESFDGELLASYAGTREVDGVTVAVIKLEGEFDTEQSMESTNDSEWGTSSFWLDTTEHTLVEGEVLWDVAAGHLHSLEIELETESISSQHSLYSSVDGDEHESEAESEGTETVTLRVEVEAVED